MKAWSGVPRARAPVTFPDLPRDYLLQSLEHAFRTGDQCHPRLKRIQQGRAVFESTVMIPYTPKCKIRYQLVCRIDLSDAMFRDDRAVEWLYFSQASPHVTFQPLAYCDRNGQVISGPI